MARTTMEADALSTSVFVMGPDKGTVFVNGLPLCESLVIAKDGTVSKSRGWKSSRASSAAGTQGIDRAEH